MRKHYFAHWLNNRERTTTHNATYVYWRLSGSLPPSSPFIRLKLDSDLYITASEIPSASYHLLS